MVRVTVAGLSTTTAITSAKCWPMSEKGAIFTARFFYREDMSRHVWCNFPLGKALSDCTCHEISWRPKGLAPWSLASHQFEQPKIRHGKQLLLWTREGDIELNPPKPKDNRVDPIKCIMKLFWPWQHRKPSSISLERLDPHWSHGKCE